MVLNPVVQFVFECLRIRRAGAGSGHEIRKLRAVHSAVSDFDEDVRVDELAFVRGHEPAVALECLVVLVFVSDQFSRLCEAQLHLRAKFKLI